MTHKWMKFPLVCRRLKRKRKSKVNCLTLEYGPKIRRIAIKELHWGVPNSYMTHFLDLSSTLPELFRSKNKAILPLEDLIASNHDNGQPSINNMVYNSFAFLCRMCWLFHSFCLISFCTWHFCCWFWHPVPSWVKAMHISSIFTPHTTTWKRYIAYNS